MTISTSQNVGLGTTSPSSKLQVSSSFDASVAGNYPGVLSSGQYGGGIGLLDTGLVSGLFAITSGQALGFFTGQSSSDTVLSKERMRIDSSGNLLVGTTSPSGKVTINGSYTLNNQNYAYFALSGTSAVSGYITNQSSAYSLWASNRISAEEFNARSDARMKKEITPIPTIDAMHFINNVQAVYYKWKDSIEDGHKFGFLAQDIVKAGFANLVGQYPSDNLAAETDADGFTSPEGVMLTISYDQIIPLLSAAIKELSAKNDALEARLAALEAK